MRYTEKDLKLDNNFWRKHGNFIEKIEEVMDIGFGKHI